LHVPAGRVGPNGAGKSTLPVLAGGLLTPTSGRIAVLGHRPGDGAAQLADVAFVAQDAPLYPSLTVADHLRFGARLNPRWDQPYAEARIKQFGLDPAQKAGRLSGGQRAQLAPTLAAAKRAQLLILDEPVASLDPLARRMFLQDLQEFVAEVWCSRTWLGRLPDDPGDVAAVPGAGIVHARGLCGVRAGPVLRGLLDAPRVQRGDPGLPAGERLQARR
jgi:ABC-2 type transport system ATP-binding protein